MRNASIQPPEGEMPQAFADKTGPPAGKLGHVGYCVLLGALTLVAFSLVQSKYIADVNDAKAQYRRESSQTVREVATKVRSAFLQMYQGMRTLARMPGIRSLGQNQGQVSPEVATTSQEVFRSLSDNIAVSEVFVVPLGLDLGDLDRSYGRPEIPLTVFDARGGLQSGRGYRDNKVFAENPEFSANEFRQISSQLEWFKQRSPNESFVRGLQYPVICGPEILTGDTSRYSGAYSNESERAGLVYSVPFFGEDQKLKGCVSCVVLTCRLTDMLPNGDFGIINRSYGFAKSRSEDGQFAKLGAQGNQGTIDPRAIFSMSAPLDISDNSQGWMIWATYPNELFYGRKEYQATSQFRDACILAIVGFSAIGFTFMGYVKRHRTMLESVNRNLEAQVKERTENLLSARKMEAIGQLAAGVAHEINTPTQFIGDNLRFLESACSQYEACLAQLDQLVAGADQSDTGAEIHAVIGTPKMARLRAEVPQAVDESLQGITRINEIVRAMRDFAHPKSSELMPVDLNQIIENSVAVARNEWKYVAEVQFDLDPSLPRLTCSPGEIGQLVVILVVNASHAIKEKGKFDSPGIIRVSTKSIDDAIHLEVADSGCGIPEEIRDQIFDQFFTTKQVGVGTGMGLAIAKNVVERHRGTITVDSKVGQGTVFSIEFPAAGRAESHGEEAA